VTVSAFRLIGEEILPYRLGSRSSSAAMLAWYLQNIWRLEPDEVDEAICDGSGDMGIDGLHFDPDLGELTIFQAKHREQARKGQGDTDLKQLVGAMQYFESADAYDGLLASSPNADLLRLLNRHNMRDRVAAGLQSKRAVFVTNATLDANGANYVAAITGSGIQLDVWDRPRLAAVAERTRRPAFRPEQIELRASDRPIEVTLTPQEQMAVALVRAEQLVTLPGIDDRTLFSRNVRLSLGRTRINRDLDKTIKNQAEHALFPAYHNGLTLLTEGLEVNGRNITLDGVSVVNGCQSLVALYDNSARLTTNLNVLVKIIVVPANSDIADEITYRTNNQNGVDMRDQRSTHPIMRDLKVEVETVFGQDFDFQIREGEPVRASASLDNQLAAQLIKAIYLGEPWAAVRKVRLFDDEFTRIFGRQVDAHKLFLLYQINRAVVASRGHLRDDLKASFASVRFALAYLLGHVLALSPTGELLLAQPARWLPGQTDEVLAALTVLAEDVADSVNFHVGEQENDDPTYDPKVAFKSKTGVDKLHHDVISHSKRQAKRANDYLFRISPSMSNGTPGR
jgi:hypothetical protein